MFLKEKTRSTFVDRWSAKLDKESFEKVRHEFYFKFFTGKYLFKLKG